MSVPEVKNGNVVPKMPRRKGRDERRTKRSWVRSCSWWPQALQEEYSPSVLFCIGKRTREGYDRSSDVGTVHNEQEGKELVHPRKPKESGRRGRCEKDFVSKKSNAQSLQWPGPASELGTWIKGSVALVLVNESASSLPVYVASAWLSW